MSTLPIFPILDTPEDTLIRWKRELENYIWNQDNVGGYNTAVGLIDALAPAGMIEAAKLGKTIIDGGYLQTVLIKASQIYGDALTLGGAANANGTFVLKNGDGDTVGTIDKDGINMTADIRTGQRFILPMPIPANITEYSANRRGTVGLQFTNSPTIDSLHLPEGYIQVQDLINILGGGTVSMPRMDISCHILMLSGNNSVIQMLNTKEINFTSSDSDVVLKVNGIHNVLTDAIPVMCDRGVLSNGADFNDYTSNRIGTYALKGPTGVSNGPGIDWGTFVVTGSDIYGMQEAFQYDGAVRKRRFYDLGGPNWTAWVDY